MLQLSLRVFAQACNEHVIIQLSVCTNAFPKQCRISNCQIDYFTAATSSLSCLNVDILMYMYNMIQARHSGQTFDYRVYTSSAYSFFIWIAMRYAQDIYYIYLLFMNCVPPHCTYHNFQFNDMTVCTHAPFC